MSCWWEALLFKSNTVLQKISPPISPLSLSFSFLTFFHTLLLLFLISLSLSLHWDTLAFPFNKSEISISNSSHIHSLISDSHQHYTHRDIQHQLKWQLAVLGISTQKREYKHMFINVLIIHFSIDWARSTWSLLIYCLPVWVSHLLPWV